MGLTARIVRALIPQGAQHRLRALTLPWRLSAALSPALPPTLCVDVGASFYPHPTWLPMLRSPAARWVAVEPNTAHLGYVDDWPWPCKVRTCTTGLSATGGQQILYVTAVDTGSSLLPPEIPPSMSHRLPDTRYFFPVVERPIDTITLWQVIADSDAEAGANVDAAVFVKLDTQGTELSILQGSEALLTSRRIVGIEMESTLLAQPFMRGSGHLWQACAFLEPLGYELLDLRPIRAPAASRAAARRSQTWLNECDAVFALRPDVLVAEPVQRRASMIGFYCAYRLHGEALSLLERDPDVAGLLRERGCDTAALAGLLRRAVA